ncbi:MAG: S9 family peptidase [Cytophagaceae bacterium]
MTKNYLPLLFVLNCLIFFIHPLFAQQKKSINLDEIWIKGSFRTENLREFRWMKDDNFYTNLEQNGNNDFSIVINSIKTGEKIKTLLSSSSLILPGQNKPLPVDDYYLSPDEKLILLLSETEPVYRRSFLTKGYIFDLTTGKLISFSDQKIQNVQFSPDSKKIAYVKANDLYCYDIPTSKEIRITFSGLINNVINGSTDWVYEEEFEFTKAWHWSPDSKKIAFYTFDESQVKEYAMQIWDGIYPENYTFKYPKAGEKNSEIILSFYDLETSAAKEIFSGKGQDLYIPRMKWTADPNVVSFIKMNRLQNQLEIIHANIATGTGIVAYKETSDSYIEINDHLHYTADNKNFIFTSEKDGYRHIYISEVIGQKVFQVTKGKWEVDELLSVDEKKQMIYYTSTEDSPMERQLYSISFNGKNKKKISREKGYHSPEISPGFSFILNVHSRINQAPKGYLTYMDGSPIRMLMENRKLQDALENFKIQPAEFFTCSTDGSTFNGWMIKPENFNKLKNSKKFPVMMFVYGGPGYQTVTDHWMGTNYFWFQMLADMGYIVVSVDVRGSGGQGAAIKKITQNNLGKFETADLISSAKYLSSLSYIDGSRIGIFGWSYGGYLSSLAMTVGADYFKAGIAVAPVTNWRFYDTIYTERYLGLPQENASGYDDYSPLTHAEKLKGAYLLVHGTADDNVHLQNAMEMSAALVAANKDFDQMYYTNKNHGIYGGYTRYHLYKKMTEFILQKL